MPNLLTAQPYAVDALYRAEKQKHFAGESKNMNWDDVADGIALKAGASAKGKSATTAESGWYVSPAIKADFPFQELLPSWNIKLNEKTQSYRVFMRICDVEENWSPWLYFGKGGTPRARLSHANKLTSSTKWGQVDVDYMMLARPAHYFQYKVALENRGSPRNAPVLQRFFVSYSNIAGDRKLFAAVQKNAARLKGDWATTLSVPYRSQLAVRQKSLRGQICCPTCVSMILESNGVNRPTIEVARTAYDSEFKIYGTWPRAAQTAAHYGMLAWVDRFRTDDDVKRVIAEGIPLMASIRAKQGELRGARYKFSGGHLICIRGFTADGDYIVNDPYSAGPGGKEIVYHKEDIAKVWFEKGGVGIVIRKP